MVHSLYTHRAGWMVAAIGAAALVLTVGAGAILASPTRGPIPMEAFPVNGGPIDRVLVPDFIPALGRDGAPIGWVSKDLAVPVVDAGDRLLIPVFGDDLRTVVGHMVAGHGFAPLGSDLNRLLDALPGPPLP